MEKILLFSDDEKLFEITKQVTEGKQELMLEENVNENGKKKCK